MNKPMKKTVNKHARLAETVTQSRKELEKQVVEGAKHALKEYGKVFERLAEYDRAEKV